MWCGDKKSTCAASRTSTTLFSSSLFLCVSLYHSVMCTHFAWQLCSSCRLLVGSVLPLCPGSDRLPIMVRVCANSDTRFTQINSKFIIIICNVDSKSFRHCVCVGVRWSVVELEQEAKAFIRKTNNNSETNEMHLTRSWNPILCYSLMTVAELLQFRPQSFYNATGTHERKIKTKHLRVSFPYISRFGSKRSLYNFSLIFAKHWFRLSFSLFHFFECARCIVCVFVFFFIALIGDKLQTNHRRL